MQHADPQSNGQAPPQTAPKQEWEPLALRTRPTPVTRLNRKVIGVLLAGGIALVAYALSSGLRAPHPAPAPVETSTSPSPRPAEGLGRMPKSYGDIVRPVAAQGVAPPPVTPPSPPPPQAPPPVPPPSSAPPAAPRGQSPEDLTAADRRRKALEEAEKARTSEVFFPLSSASQRQATAPERMQMAQAGHPPAGSSAQANEVMEKYFAPQAEKREFLTRTGKDGTTVLPNPLQEPLSPYEVKAGTLIPAVLLTGINADLPGQLIAQVREPVYDTVSGHYLLIPQGTRILGTYDSAVVPGQDRVLVVWTRLVFPNGDSLRLDGMPGVDLAGYAGFTDRVNHHVGRLIGSVVLSSVLSLGVRLPFGDVEKGRLLPTLGQESADQVGAGINRAGQSIVQRQLMQQPTIEIRPGFAVNVFVNADLVLRPYPGTGSATPAEGGRP